jgi:hypothetical protein
MLDFSPQTFGNYMRFVTLFLVATVSANTFADSTWETDYSDGVYIHRGVFADKCKSFVDDTIKQLYDDPSGEFYGYMHQYHPQGETEEQSVYGVFRDVYQDAKTSFGCTMTFVSHDVTNEGDYKSQISFSVEFNEKATVVLINNVEKK